MSENKPVFIALAVAALVILGLGIYYYTQDEKPSPISEPVELDVIEPQVVEPEPNIIVPPSEEVKAMMEPEPETPAFVLPSLDDSDQIIRDGAVSLTRHEGVNAWLSPNELVRKMVVFIDNVASGQIARESGRILAPKGAFTATPIDDKSYLLDVKTYARYDQVTNILRSLDTKRSVEFYGLLKPLFESAYNELGYPGGDFDGVMQGAIAHLLETPTLTEPIRLIRPVVMYEFEDPNIERLSSAQKQLIRMGPNNMTVIQAKLKALATELRRLK